jgi:exosortase H (IPTLxxWG-CTERM-specific)
MNREKLLFLLKFVAILVVLYAVIAFGPVNDRVIVPFTKAITVVSTAALRFAGQAAEVSGTVIALPGFAVDVKNGCNGIEALVLLVAAIGAFPAPWTMRIAGIIGGFFAIQLVNVVRIATLAWMGAKHPQVFQMFHVAVWQTLIILFSLFIFLIWSSRIAPRRLAGGV